MIYHQGPIYTITGASEWKGTDKEPGSFQGSNSLKVSNTEEGNRHPDPRSSKKKKKDELKEIHWDITIKNSKRELWKQQDISDFYTKEKLIIFSALFHGNGIGWYIQNAERKILPTKNKVTGKLFFKNVEDCTFQSQTP